MTPGVPSRASRSGEREPLVHQRSSLFAALAFGGFTDAEETERVAVWAAEHIDRLEAEVQRLREALLAAKHELSGEHDFDADVRAGVLRQITVALDEIEQSHG